MMDYIRKNKKTSIIVLVSLVVFLTIGAVLARYVYNIINNYILETKAFYFNSSVMTMSGKTYNINNWTGAESYPLLIDINNYKGDLSNGVHTKSDISYTVSVTCGNSSKYTCSSSETNGILREEDFSKNFEVAINPVAGAVFDEDDVATITVKVTSNSPYKKSMSATYRVGIIKRNFSYEIDDSVKSKFLTINFLNAVEYYEVETAFNGHPAGSTIRIEEYNQLSDADKAKCFSAKVKISWNPNTIFLDMTNGLYRNRLNTNYLTQNIDGYTYVRQFEFKMGAASSESIIFYKDDINQNYGFPIPNANSIINVDVVTANGS